jgi:hypothetical protein
VRKGKKAQVASPAWLRKKSRRWNELESGDVGEQGNEIQLWGRRVALQGKYLVFFCCHVERDMTESGRILITESHFVIFKLAYNIELSSPSQRIPTLRVKHHQSMVRYPRHQPDELSCIKTINPQNQVLDKHQHHSPHPSSRMTNHQVFSHFIKPEAGGRESMISSFSFHHFQFVKTYT